MQPKKNKNNRHDQKSKIIRTIYNGIEIWFEDCLITLQGRHFKFNSRCRANHEENSRLNGQLSKARAVELARSLRIKYKDQIIKKPISINSSSPDLIIRIAEG